jgi:hypothetical protein
LPPKPVSTSTGKYVYEGVGMQRGRLQEYGGFASDQWRIKQNLTINPASAGTCRIRSTR